MRWLNRIVFYKNGSKLGTRIDLDRYTNKKVVLNAMLIYSDSKLLQLKQKSVMSYKGVIVNKKIFSITNSKLTVAALRRGR